MAAAALLHELPPALRERVAVASAGIAATGGAPMSGEARGALQRAGITAGPHHSRRFTADLLEAADLVLAMKPAHAEVARQLAPAILAASDGPLFEAGEGEWDASGTPSRAPP
jgi:protein-tyrosine-phosphatase